MSDPLARARALAERAKTTFSGLSRSARILAVTTVAAMIVIGAYFSLRSAWEPYATLYGQLDRDDAAALTAKLKELKIPYRLTEGGTAIEVPEARVYDTRLELASAGLPRGGGVGFETFDKMRLGATEFEQRVMYRRALEGEIVRTISTLAAVQSARVHLVLPEKSVFLSRSEPASASIVVKLRVGASLGAGEVGGIVHLVAASVPGLSPERVALVTAEGVMLHRPRRAEGAGGVDEDALSERQAAQSALEDRVRGMLERLVGQGHADVRVSAEVDAARVEHVEDHYDPARAILRSSDETIERVAQEGTVAGVPGAESNAPLTGGGGAAGGGSSVVRESKTHNFEIDHVSDKRIQNPGTLKRLTIAVVLDGVPGPGGKAVSRPREELDRMAALVASAAGADVKRGDVVTVDSIPFVLADLEPSPSTPAPSAARWKPTTPVLAAVGAGALLLVVVAFAVRRRRRPKTAARIVELPAGAPPAPLLEGEAAARLVDWRGDAVALASADPATAALVVRAWLGAGEEAARTP